VSEQQYHVGQELWRHDVNERRLGGPQRVTVTKVGRALVTVATDRGWAETFRIESGRSNDAFGHGSLCTDAEHAAHIDRAGVMERLMAHHISPDTGYGHTHPIETLRAIADLLDATTPPAIDTTAAHEHDERTS
jgi:hypothetical protein